jgi:hypothetical protein
VNPHIHRVVTSFEQGPLIWGVMQHPWIPGTVGARRVDPVSVLSVEVQLPSRAGSRFFVHRPQLNQVIVQNLLSLNPHRNGYVAKTRKAPFAASDFQSCIPRSQNHQSNQLGIVALTRERTYPVSCLLKDTAAKWHTTI